MRCFDLKAMRSLGSSVVCPDSAHGEKSVLLDMILMSGTDTTDTLHPLGQASCVGRCYSYSSVPMDSTKLMQGLKFQTRHLILDAACLGSPGF